MQRNKQTTQNSSYITNNLFIKKQKKVDYAILSAMPEELNFITSKFSLLKFEIVNVGDFSFKIYDYQNTKVLIAHTGIGTAFAASTLTLLHSAFHPEYFLISGTAGGIREDLKIGDVVIAETAFEAEMQEVYSQVKGTPFETCLSNPLKNAFFPSTYTADPELLEIALSLNLENAYRGSVVSSNAFPAPKELFERIKSFNPCSIDMETSAFYQIAWLLNTKAIAIRGISNVLNSDGTDENVKTSDLHGSSLAAASALLSILNKSVFLKKQKFSSNKTDNSVQELIEKFNLQPHPEGGYFAPFYKSRDNVKSENSERYNDETRSAGTSIYYLLKNDNFSAWHKLKSDEIWHFYKGSPLNLHVIDKNNGNLTSYLLGDPLKTDGATFQVCIEAGNYFAAENTDKTSYCLAGCTVSPGFEYQDFELSDKSYLSALYPNHKALIEKLCHKDVNSALEMINDDIKDSPSKTSNFV